MLYRKEELDHYMRITKLVNNVRGRSNGRLEIVQGRSSALPPPHLIVAFTGVLFVLLLLSPSAT